MKASHHTVASSVRHGTREPSSSMPLFNEIAKSTNGLRSASRNRHLGRDFPMMPRESCIHLGYRLFVSLAHF